MRTLLYHCVVGLLHKLTAQIWPTQSRPVSIARQHLLLRGMEEKKNDLIRERPITRQLEGGQLMALIVLRDFKKRRLLPGLTELGYNKIRNC